MEKLSTVILEDERNGTSIDVSSKFGLAMARAAAEKYCEIKGIKIVCKIQSRVFARGYCRPVNKRQIVWLVRGIPY